MGKDLEAEAQRFLERLRPREDPELGELESLLTANEIEAIEKCCFEQTYIDYAEFARLGASHSAKRLSPLAQLQLLIGLGEGRVSGQVKAAVVREMNRRDWVWPTEHGGIKKTPLARETGVSNTQIHDFMTSKIVNTSTLDRISQIVELEVIPWGEGGWIHNALASTKSSKRKENLRDDASTVDQGWNGEAEDTQGGTVTQQIRRELKGVMRQRGWTQKEMAFWTGVSQSTICRFLLGGEIKTVALDLLGAFLWVEIVEPPRASAH
jgi:DNA-binding Xre family transcriptional regulator